VLTLARRGATLVELLVAMGLAAVLLGAASSTLLHQRRDADSHASASRAESQARGALGALQAVLAGLSPQAGDLAPGEARDTALQLRTVVASAEACDSAVGRVTLAADDTSDARTSGVAAAPKIGDTLWWRPPDAPDWLARRVTDVSTSAGICFVGGNVPQALLHLALALPDSVPRGTPLRVTRPARFSFYHAGDGSWQLGVAEWSDVFHAFAPPQPVAGPFALAAPAGARTGFRYFDAAGGALPVGAQGADVTRIARVRIALVTIDRSGGSPDPVVRLDSVDVALRHAP